MSSNDQPIPNPGLYWPQAAWQYAVDTAQRSVLYADVMRQRGDQYHAHMAQEVPHVLSMPAEVIMSGLELPRPANYGLARIIPPEGLEPDPTKRPFVVVDPRAGHGPGIGGFKAESEIGVALRAGHPCYFIGFTPHPAPGQTIEDVMRAEAAFLERVIELHPESEGKPVVIGNCQAGWQIMMTAAMRPELFGPIIIAGAPMSYWAGWRGQNPMRYSGGLLGGTWLTALTADLGGGKFDGAWLVQNFENLNPANTLWTKQYNLYAKVDTEAARYLGFEKYWGGYVFLNDVEIQYIVDNLFVGNKLASSELVTSDGVRIDLRNIRSPIVVFCSKGDNITPPPQALGWITDLYRNDEEIRAHDQTIVYAVHDSIGHLGIFVSGSVGRKEHQEFANNIDLIDLLPAGIHQAVITDKTPDTLNADLAFGDYVLGFEERTVEDVRKIVAPNPEDDWRFATVDRVSKINLGLYRSFVKPLIEAGWTPQLAELTRKLHPLRLSYEAYSSKNPWLAPVEELAKTVREHRAPVAADNPFQVLQDIAARNIESALDTYRELRDGGYEQAFMSIYGSPWLQAMVGLQTGDRPAPRKHPGVTPEHLAFVEKANADMLAERDQGGLIEAGVRLVYHMSHAPAGVDERAFNLIRKMRTQRAGPTTSLTRFKQIVRKQVRLMEIDEAAALADLPKLLRDADADRIRALSETVALIASIDRVLDAEGQARLVWVQDQLEAIARSKAPVAQAATAATPSPDAPQAVASSAPASRAAAARRAPVKTASTAKAASPKTAPLKATASTREAAASAKPTANAKPATTRATPARPASGTTPPKTATVAPGKAPKAEAAPSPAAKTSPAKPKAKAAAAAAPASSTPSRSVKPKAAAAAAPDSTAPTASSNASAASVNAASAASAAAPAKRTASAKAPATRASAPAAAVAGKPAAAAEKAFAAIASTQASSPPPALAAARKTAAAAKQGNRSRTSAPVSGKAGRARKR